MIAGADSTTPHVLLCRRFAGQNPSTEAGPVLVVFDVARSTNKIRKLCLRRIADQAGRFRAVLYLLDGLEQRLAYRRDDNIGRTETLLGAVLDRALGFDRKGILRREVQPHATPAVATLECPTIL